MKRILLILVFIFTTTLTLGATLFAVLITLPAKHSGLLSPQNSMPKIGYQAPQVLAAQTSIVTQTTTIQTADARPVIIQKYLDKYKSPLSPYATTIVHISDQYGLDWRLLVAIAQQESNLGKKTPENSFNAWGWGITSKGTLRFASWEEGITAVAKGLKEKYYAKGLTTIEDIMAVYCPNSTGSWANGVSQFIHELETGQVD